MKWNIVEQELGELSLQYNQKAEITVDFSLPQSK